MGWAFAVFGAMVPALPFLSLSAVVHLGLLDTASPCLRSLGNTATRSKLSLTLVPQLSSDFGPHAFQCPGRGEMMSWISTPGAFTSHSGHVCVAVGFRWCR